MKIKIKMPDHMLMPDNMRKFEKEEQKEDFSYNIHFTNDLKGIVDRFITEHLQVKEIRRKNMIILLSDQEELRIIWIIGTNRPYAVTIEKKGEETEVWVDEWISPLMNSDTVFGSLLGLEKRMISQDAMILHSAYINKDGKAILFTAPSGTGKSTQADLWEKYRGTRTINGDRTLMVRKENGWYAYGWPICGSSEICFNESYPIQAIVVIRQAEENEVEKLDQGESVKKILSEITVNTWNSEFQMKIFELLEKLTAEVPVYRLSCNISEEAVQCLEEKI